MWHGRDLLGAKGPSSEMDKKEKKQIQKTKRSMSE